MKKFLSIIMLLMVSLSILSGCAVNDDQGSSTDENTTTEQTQGETTSADTTSEDTTADETASGDKTTLKVAALDSAYGVEMWGKIKEAFEKINENVTIELITDKKLEDVIGSSMKAGDYPDFVHLAVGREAALTETLIKEEALLNLSDVLDMTVPGESVKVSEKIVPGFTDTLITNPYNDGQTYLAPMFYGPCGLFYNAGLFEEKGWTVPETWDEMWELGDKAQAEGISLFTYPTAGYFDAFFYALLNVTGGPDLFNKAMVYTEGIWDSAEATRAFEIVTKLAQYTEPSTPANANDDNFTKNQQLILDNKALFMPNGTWVVDEMGEAPRAEGFKWGFTALPSVDAEGDRYSYTFFEQSWIPAEAKNIDLAKEFMAFMYSDEAASIFAEAGAIQPIEGISSKLTGDNQLFYGIYDTGAKAAMGNFATTEPVEGVSMADTLFGTVNSLVSGDKTQDEWVEAVKQVSDTLRGALK